MKASKLRDVLADAISESSDVEDALVEISIADAVPSKLKSIFRERLIGSFEFRHTESQFIRPRYKATNYLEDCTNHNLENLMVLYPFREAEHDYTGDVRPIDVRFLKHQLDAIWSSRNKDGVPTNKIAYTFVCTSTLHAYQATNRSEVEDIRSWKFLEDENKFQLRNWFEEDGVKYIQQGGLRLPLPEYLDEDQKAVVAA